MMRYCQRCVLPNTRPNLHIDESGICNACQSHGEKKQVNWAKREQDFRMVVEHAKSRSRGYDCLIPVSGGKDSTWQTVVCLEYGLKPLAYTWRPPGRTVLGQQNLDNLRHIGVDHIDYSINPKVEAKFMLAAFRRFGTTGIPMHMAMHHLALTLATNFNIPLIVWGENSAVEYGEADAAHKGFRLTYEWLEHYGVTHGTGPTDWISEELSRADLVPYFRPSQSEFERQDIYAVFLGHYFNWDTDMTRRVALEHGFQVNNSARVGLYDYADIDDDFISLHHFLKWYKFGFTRLWDNLSLEIRNGRITREQAIETIAQIGDQTPLDDIAKFCAFTGITVAEFFAICETFRNPNVWSYEKGKWRINGFLIDTWAW